MRRETHMTGSRIKKIFTAILTVSLLCTWQTAVFAADLQSGSGDGSAAEVVKREYVLSADSDLKVLKLPEYIKEIEFADDHTALIRVDNGISQEDIFADLQTETRNLLVQPNYVYEAAKTNDPYYSLQWGLLDTQNGMDIDFEKAYRYISQSGESLQKTVVAVIDSGIDFTHSDLSENMWKNTGEIAGNGIDDDGNGYIDDVYGYDFANGTALRAESINSEYNHGTHCAGTIAAVSDNWTGICGVAGVTDAVSLMSVKVLRGKEGTGSTFALVKGIKYAEANGADICNLSMGSYANDITLYNTIASSDMLFVCAAGNDRSNLDSRLIYPGCYDLDNIICVGNARRTGVLNTQSNYSSTQVDIAAPGTDIYSTLAGGGYGNMSGTSMAAPFVTGTAALLHSWYPDINAPELRFLILDGADTRSTLGGKVAKNRYLNAYTPLTYTEDDYHIDTKAPILKATVSKISGSYKQRLNVTASDDSGREPKVMYARGDKTLTYFRSGMGYRVNLDEEGKGTKTMAVPSVYSVYAVDAAGNDVLYKVKCTANAVSSIKLNYSSKSIYRGKSYTLKATLSKNGVNGRKLTWTSSNKKVATVSSKGKVTALKKGKAVITVKTSNGLSRSCTITVK